MKERTRNIFVGITALVGLGCVAVMLMLFGSLPSLLEKGYIVRVQFASASGLSAGSRVRLNGIDVGNISKVELLHAPKHGVEVTAKINQDMDLPEGVTAHIQSPLIGGSPSLELDISKVSGEGKSLAKDGSVMLTGESSTFVSQLSQNLQAALAEPMKKFDRLNDNFEKLSSEWARVGQNINQLTRPLTAAEVDDGKSPGNLASTIARADQRLKEMQVAIAGINKWVNDEKLRTDMQVAVANARNISDKVDKSVDQIREVVANTKEVVASTKESVDKLSKRYIAVADDLSAAITSARKTLDQARAGDGTVGKLLNDPKLYNNLNDSVQRVDQAMAEFKLLLEKWKSEGLNVGFN